MKENVPFVSIIVPVRNGANHIGLCLESICALDWPRERREVIVVDNGSTDGTQEIVQRFEEVQLLEESRRGAAIARNVGWRSARGELIAFTDSDCSPARDWLKRLTPAFDDDTVGAAGGHLEGDTPRNLVEEYILKREILSQELALREEFTSPPFIITANAIYRKIALEQVDGFDEWLIVNGEDADLCWRVNWAGWQVAYIAEAVVVHRHRSRLLHFLRQVRSYGAGTSYLFAKHRERLGYKRFTWKQPYFDLLKNMALTPVKLITGRTPMERYGPLFDALSAASFLSGKLGASLRLRVWNV